MALKQFKATVIDDRMLALPEEACSLGLKPGDRIVVSIDELEAQRDVEIRPEVRPNVRALAVLREIAERQKDLPFTDGSDTPGLIREARRSDVRV